MAPLQITTVSAVNAAALQPDGKLVVVGGDFFDLRVARYGADGAAGVQVSLRNLRTFPWVAEREQAGTLALRGAFFSIADGILHLLDEERGRFSPA